MWVADEFRDEPWFSFNGYQSGHNDSAESMRWHAEGPPSQGWKKEPHHPEINLEPNYEAHIARPSMKVFDAHAVRRAAYWSLLIAPPAGVSYGGHGIWSWELKPNPPMTHPYTGTAPPWHEAMKHPGSTSMKHLKDLFSSLEWWRLRPDQDALVDQPGGSPPTGSSLPPGARAATHSWPTFLKGARLRSRWIASSPVSPHTGSIPRPGRVLRSAGFRTRELTSSRRREAGIGFCCWKAAK